MVLFLTALACAAPALAQQSTVGEVVAQQAPVAPARESGGRTVTFMPRYEFHLQGERLSGNNPRYVWDGDFGGEVDAVDYGVGRFTFWANYQVVMGEQLHIFDPNQGNYILAGSLSVRARGVEVAGVFYHQSRHLSDRLKIAPVDWNMMGGRLIHETARGGLEWHGIVDLRRTIQSSFVDYVWELDTDARARVRLRRRVKFVAGGGVRVLGVDGSRDRGVQTGFRTEAGVRLEGSAGAMELFVAGERRIDPYPVEFGSSTFIKAGFRLLGN